MKQLCHISKRIFSLNGLVPHLGENEQKTVLLFDLSVYVAIYEVAPLFYALKLGDMK